MRRRLACDGVMGLCVTLGDQPVSVCLRVCAVPEDCVRVVHLRVLTEREAHGGCVLHISVCCVCVLCAKGVCGHACMCEWLWVRT